MMQPERLTPPDPDREDKAYDDDRQRKLDDEMEKKWAVRFSHLRAYGRSAAHGRHAMLNDSEETYAMERGSAVHALLFKTKKVMGYPGATRRGKEYAAFAAMHTDAHILTMSEYDKALKMAEAIAECKLAQPFLQGVTEETLLFRWNGLNCRATPDVRGDDFVTELKTSSSADPMKFVWHARRMAYHAQLRFQEYGCAANKFPVNDHFIVCVESDAPHPVTVFHLEPEAREEGERMLTLWAERLKNCEASNAYPPYVDCVVPLVWPKDDFELDYGGTE
jgi:hypothetical protein